MTRARRMALPLALLLTACAYSTAVDTQLWPLLQGSFAEIRLDVQWYLDATPDDTTTRATLAAFEDALAARDAAAVLALWPRLQPAALAGVDAMEAAGRGQVTARFRREEVGRYAASVGRLRP